MGDGQDYGTSGHGSGAEGADRPATGAVRAPWDVIDGRVPRHASSGYDDGLVRALCWGNRPARAPMAALVDVVRTLETRVAALEAELGGARGCPCVGTPDEKDCPHEA